MLQTQQAEKLTVQCCAVGVVIANSFGNANTAFYVYTKPSTTSVMQNAKGGKDDFSIRIYS